MNENLYAVLRGAFQSALDKTFLAPPGGAPISYAAIDARSAQLANVLADRNVHPGDRVVVQIPKSVEAVALYLACLRTGAVYVPLNTSYTTPEVQYFIDDAEPEIFVCANDSDVKASQSLQLSQLSHEADSKPETQETVVSQGDDLAAMLYTSGTTGRSKGAMLTHANLLSNAQALHEIWGFAEGDVLLHVLPIFHVHGLFVALHTAMLNASKVIFLERFTVEGALDHLGDCSVMMGVPTHYIRLLEDARFDSELCSSMRLFTSGSAPMTETVHQLFSKRTGHQILERYGMTEAGMITSNPYDGERVPGTVGYPLPGVQLRVCDDDGTPCGEGVAGVVEMKGPNLFAGYWQLPERTESEHRADGFFITGDVGFVDESGRLTLEGRAGDMIISGGYNIYPKEIELIIDSVEGVSESAVIGIPSGDLGETPLAVVVADATGVTSDVINATLESNLARFKRPRRIEFVDELPRNAMGKVQKAILRQQFSRFSRLQND